MNTKTKKSVVMKAEPVQAETKVKKVTKVESTDLNKEVLPLIITIRNKMTNLETAYLEALSGKIKFGEVKSMFKKLHKEIKGSRKK